MADQVPTDPYAVDIEACCARQRRLALELQQKHVEVALLTRRESVQWLTGVYLASPYETIAAITDQGHVTVVMPEHAAEMRVAADVVATYVSQLQATFRDEQRQACSKVLVENLHKPSGVMGGEFAWLDRNLFLQFDNEWIDIEPLLLYFRRKKDPDHLRMLQRANDANRAMYAHARQIIEPGLNELDLYSALHSVAVRELGEPLTYFGHDFQCNSIGGPPRDRQAHAGELYILDLGVGFRGFRSDNARTVSVGGEVSCDQKRAWDCLTEVFQLVESTVQPGTSCRELYDQVKQMLEPCLPWTFEHHLGHGVGLAPHETPRLNPYWDDDFEEWDVFTVEPGLYHDELLHGMRLEQNYCVISGGVDLLTDWPLEL